MLSAIPVALIANIARITLTGILHETVGGPAADHFYHDLAGWVMILFAFLLYWGEIWLLSHILIEAEYAPFRPAQSMGNRRPPISRPNRWPCFLERTAGIDSGGASIRSDEPRDRHIPYIFSNCSGD